MTDLRWPRETTFRDTSRSPAFVVQGSGVYDAPDDRIEAYRTRGWVDPSAGTASDDGESDLPEPDTATQQMSGSEPDTTSDDDDDDGDGGDSDAHDATDSSIDAEMFVGERTVNELEAALESGDHDDSDRLEALLDAEQAGKDRTGAKDAIRDRMD
jgi:hypothetical protein